MSKKSINDIKITKRADGRYMARYSNDVLDKPITVYGASESEVKGKLRQLEHDVKNGTYIKPHYLSVGEWLKTWLLKYAKIAIKQSTYISYDGYIRNHCVPLLGEIKLLSLTNGDLQHLFTEKSKKLAPKTLRNIYNMLHAALEQALVSRLIPFNPVLGVRLPKAEKQEMRVFSMDEQTALEKELVKSQTLSDFGITFALHTGVRLGELLAVQWGDLNHDKKTVTIRRSLARLNKVDENGNVLMNQDGVKTTEIVIQTPKTTNSIREIPLYAELWDALMEYKKKQQALQSKMAAISIGGWKDGFIFSQPSGKHHDPKAYVDHYKRLLRWAGVEEAKFHTLRHTFATRALEANMDIKVLSSLLGHADASTTLNKYGHALPDHKRASMEKMRQYLNSQSLPQSDDEADELLLEEAV